MSLSQEEEQNEDKRFSDKTWPSWSVDQREPTFITLEGNNLEDVFGKINKQLVTNTLLLSIETDIYSSRKRYCGYVISKEMKFHPCG